jgi:hypothetical protein
MARLAERCTNGCTENAQRRDELARIVALVAQLPGTDAERAELFARAVELVLNQANESQRSPTGAAPIRRRLHPVEPAIGSRFLVGGVVLSS